MKKLLVILTAVVLGLTAFSFTACDLGGKEKLIIYTEAGFAPWEFTKEGTLDVVGVDMEIGKYIANKYGYEIEVINGSFDAIVAGIDEDNAIGLAGISYNAERALAVDYSTFYWGDAFQAIVYLNSVNPTLTDGAFAVSNFDGKKIVYQTGTTSQLTVTENKEDWQVASTADFGQVMAALEEMKTTANTFLMVDSQVAAQLCANDNAISWAPIEGVEAEQYGAVVKKGNTELLKKVNDALAELLEKDSTGKNQIEKWFEQYSAIEPAE